MTKEQDELLVELERIVAEAIALNKMCGRLSFALRSVNLIGGSDSRRTALCDEADALLQRCAKK